MIPFWAIVFVAIDLVVAGMIVALYVMARVDDDEDYYD